jgi:hypothetical protein
MGLPSQPVTLSAAQIEELNRKLSTMRHDINNNLSLIIAAAEMVRFKPDLLTRMMDTLNQQPGRISASMSGFTDEFEKTMGITRP